MTTNRRKIFIAMFWIGLVVSFMASFVFTRNLTKDDPACPFPPCIGVDVQG